MAGLFLDSCGEQLSARFVLRQSWNSSRGRTAAWSRLPVASRVRLSVFAVVYFVWILILFLIDYCSFSCIFVCQSLLFICLLAMPPKSKRMAEERLLDVEVRRDEEE